MINWVYGLVAVLLYLVYDFYVHGQLFRSFFCRYHNFFYYHPTLGKFLGIRYLRSDQWSTNRDESRVAIANAFNILYHVTGTKFKFGDRNHISIFKKRQQSYSRSLNLSTHFVKLAGKRLSLDELEEVLVKVWTDELSATYGIAVNTQRFAHLILMFRKLLSVFTGDIFSGLKYLFSNFSDFRELRSILITMPFDEQLIMTVPFLTTVDSSIFNFTAIPEPVKQFNELFHVTPVEYIPIDNKFGQVILFIVPNAANHPGNTVFGAQGMICPGNTVTSMLMKSVADVKRRLRPQVEGKLKLIGHGPLKQITNPQDIFVTFHHRPPSEIEELEHDHDLDLTRTGDE